MNKKGFTIIEIIISLTILMLISGISVITLYKNNNSELTNITEKIIEATNVYISIEKDNNGILYRNGINAGGKGVQIPVKTLYETGYISEEVLNTLYNNTNKENLYVFVSNSIKNGSDTECGTNGLSYKVNWEETNEPIYLCPINTNSGCPSCEEQPNECDGKDKYICSYNISEWILKHNDTPTEIKNINDAFYSDMSFYGDAVDGLAYEVQETKHSGLFKRKNSDGEDIYYYRGYVDNNYAAFIDGYSSVNNNMFRIVDFNNDYIKLVTEKSADLYDENNQYFLNKYNELNKGNLYYEENGLLNYILSNYIYSFNYATYFDPEGCKEDIKIFEKYFTETKFCMDYSWSMEKQSMSCKQSINSKYGLLTEEDVHYAGVHRYDDSYFIVNNTFLTTGDSTLLLSSNGDNHITLINKPNKITPDNCKEGRDEYYNGFGTLHTEKCITPEDILANGIRPVIILKTSAFEISGSGNIDSPYIFKIKGTTEKYIECEYYS